jgi:nitroreductase
MRREKMRDLLQIIRERHSERGSFDPARPIAKSDLDQILEAARWAPTPTNMQNFEIVVVDDKPTLEAIGKVPATMPESFLRENYAQLSFSVDELRKKKTGMLASEFPAAWTSPQAWDPESDYRFQLTFLGRSVQEHPLLLFVLYDANKRAPGSVGDFLGHMGLGCVLENMWLVSESLGIGFHVLTVFSDTQIDRDVKAVLHVPPYMKVAYVCALGYPVSSSAPKPPRVRRDVEEFTHHNIYGVKDWVEETR